jgi:4-diphosphocytidyl-2C-methyl-D-erythritol kinase
MMSGSGSTVFAILDDDADGEAIKKQALELCGPGGWAVVTSTV